MTAEICAYGETAVLVQFTHADNTSVIDRVMALNRRVLDRRIRGVVSTTPSYASLLVCLNPTQLSLSHLTATLRDLIDSPEPSETRQGQLWQLPTCFDRGFAEDGSALEVELSLSWNQLVEAFCAVDYRVSAIGFLPGFAYLGGLPSELHCRRLDTPRARVPASSVAIAGGQAGIYPMDSPGGWRILGRLPFSVFDRRRASPSLFSPNDTLQFRPVSRHDFNEARQKGLQGLLDQQTSRP